MSDDAVRLFALWMLAHEAADEEMKAAILRGQAAGSGSADSGVAGSGGAGSRGAGSGVAGSRSAGSGGMAGGPDAFVDGLAALVAEEKDRLKREISTRAPGAATPSATGATLDDVRFEIAEVRGRLDAIEARLDALMRAMERQ